MRRKLDNIDKKAEKGFSLIEVLVGFAIIGILFASLTGLMRQNILMARDTETMGEKSQDIAYAMMTITRAIRSAQPGNISTTGGGKNIILDGAGQPERFKFNNGQHRIDIKNGSGGYDTLITGIDDCNFSLTIGSTGGSNPVTLTMVNITLKYYDEKNNKVPLTSQVYLRNNT
jgi:prepilin-type N-terminal cleavage/methylation domain-containing protein